jgi:predicted dehydrogenase
MTTVAFVGCAHIHTPGFITAIKKRDDIKVKSVWDHDAARAKKKANDLGAAVVDDFNAIYADKEIEAVVICSETDRHEALVIPAAAAKKKIFAEKPLGIGSKDAHTVADAIEQSGVMFQTGYFMRGLPANLFIKEKIESGAFGKITRARYSVCHSGALGGWFDTDMRWMADPKRSGVGGFGDLGTHGLDILMWWLGDVDHCTAAIDNGIAKYPNCDELGEGLIRFKSGVIATLAASWDDVANPIDAQIAGTEGHAVVIGGKVFYQSKHDAGSDIKKQWEDLPKPKHAGFEAYLDAITGKPAELVKVRDAAARSAVMEAMYLSAKQQKSVTPA